MHQPSVLFVWSETLVVATPMSVYVYVLPGSRMLVVSVVSAPPSRLMRTVAEEPPSWLKGGDGELGHVSAIRNGVASRR